MLAKNTCNVDFLRKNFGLQNKVVLVTGAASGIGFAIAKQLGLAGAVVIINDLDEIKCIEAAEKLKPYCIEVKTCPFDVSNENEVKQQVDKILNETNGIDVLVCNAGNQYRKSLLEQTSQERQAIFNVHIHGAFNCVDSVLPSMIEKQNGKIILMTSVMSFVCMPNISAYSASKGALTSLTRSIAIEYADKGITCNAIAPGFVKTPFTTSYQSQDEFMSYLNSAVPMKRWAIPDEVANAVVFLASSASSFINGHTLTIDGGLLAKA